MDWQKQLKETQEKQPIKLIPFLETCCYRLDTTPDEVINGLLTQHNIDDILTGEVPVYTVIAHIKVWTEDGKQKINKQSMAKKELIFGV